MGDGLVGRRRGEDVTTAALPSSLQRWLQCGQRAVAWVGDRSAAGQWMTALSADMGADGRV